MYRETCDGAVRDLLHISRDSLTFARFAASDAAASFHGIDSVRDCECVCALFSMIEYSVQSAYN